MRGRLRPMQNANTCVWFVNGAAHSCSYTEWQAQSVFTSFWLSGLKPSPLSGPLASHSAYKASPSPQGTGQGPEEDGERHHNQTAKPD
jgi:hypothetical protein